MRTGEEESVRSGRSLVRIRGIEICEEREGEERWLVMYARASRLAVSDLADMQRERCCLNCSKGVREEEVRDCWLTVIANKGKVSKKKNMGLGREGNTFRFEGGVGEGGGFRFCFAYFEFGFLG